MALDPNTPPVGRQPAKIMVRPSGDYPWYGTIVGGLSDELAVTGGLRFTREQVQQLISRGLDVLTVPTLAVKRQATEEEAVWPTDQLPPVFAFDCPIIGHRAGRIKVVAPSGQSKLVLPDGWAHHPFRKLNYRRMFCV